LQPLDRNPFSRLKKHLSEQFKEKEGEKAAERRFRILKALARASSTAFSQCFVAAGWLNSHLYPANPEGIILENGCKSNNPPINIPELVKNNLGYLADRKKYIKNNGVPIVFKGAAPKNLNCAKKKSKG